MPSRLRSRPLADFIEPCLPRPADRPPAGPDWLHEIKHDGFRIMARRDGDRVRLLTRNGHDFVGRFPLAAAAVAALSARSCLIDGEVIVTDQKGPMCLRSDRARRRGPPSRADRNPQEHPEVATARQACGYRVQRALHRGWRDRLPPGLRARLRGHRVKAPGLALSLRPRRLLAEGQESSSARGHA